MSTIQGLPAHILLVHLVVVLVPLTAGLAVICAVWPSARKRLIWLVAALAVVIAVVTPLTAEAGEWLISRVQGTAALGTHADLGETMPYFSLALLVGVVLLVLVHFRDYRERPLPRIAVIGVAVVVIAVSAASVVQVYRIGDSGSRSAWGEIGSSS